MPHLFAGALFNNYVSPTWERIFSPVIGGPVRNFALKIVMVPYSLTDLPYENIAIKFEQ